MTRPELIARVARLFAERGHAEYHGEAVSQLEHALQAATLAEAEGADPDLIAAALLHDVGHLLHGHGEHAADQGIDDRHEELGYRFLLSNLGPSVATPVRMHVPAKRYLCATDPAYLASLSPASVASLHLQGGPMTPTEVAGFEADPRHLRAVVLRQWDDRAKTVGLQTPDFEHFHKFLEAVGANHPS